MMIPWKHDNPPAVGEGPAYTILYEAGEFAAYCVECVDFSEVRPEARAHAMADYYDFAFAHYLAAQMAASFARSFTPRVVSLN